jgi:hypothetical protein
MYHFFAVSVSKKLFKLYFLIINPLPKAMNL